MKVQMVIDCDFLRLELPYWSPAGGPLMNRVAQSKTTRIERMIRMSQ